MAEIIYFGTNGCSGHYPIGIDQTLTGAEYNMWCECDNETWINYIRKNPGRHVIKHHGEVYVCDIEFDPFLPYGEKRWYL